MCGNTSARQQCRAFFVLYPCDLRDGLPICARVSENDVRSWRIVVSILKVISVVFAVFGSLVTSSFAQDKIGEDLGRLLDQLLKKDAPPRIQQPNLPTQTGKRIPFARSDMELSFAPLVKATSSSVVNVYASTQVIRRSPFGDDPFFEQFFGNDFSGPPRVQSSLGSGVIVDGTGIIVTNNHVIANADEVKVALPDGREFESRILLKDDRVDLAILKIETDEPLPALEFANSDALEVGDLVLAMGNPFGVGQTTTSGIISALARSQIGVSDFGFFIQTDAAINPGNSGGALINMSGKLIGINTAIFSRSGGSIGIGFAIPSNMVRAVVEAAKGGGAQFIRPYIGATFEPVSSDVAESLGMRKPFGALVNAVARGGPAERGGLKVGDVVLSMDGFTVEHPDALGYRLSTAGVGKVARFEVLSRGAARLVSIKLERAPETAPADEMEVEGNSPLAGSVIANLSPRLAEELRMPSEVQGVVIKQVYRNSPAMRFGLERGDIILEINGVAALSSKAVVALVSKPANLWKFKINRGGQIIRQFFR
jgi:Do/DeqQ family serine protease